MRSHSSKQTRTSALILAVLSSVALLLGTAGTAQAETFTYWSLWVEEDGAWSPAQTGAAEIKLTDNSVLGARYVASEVELKASDAPKDEPVYETLCPDTQPQEGQTAVAVVIDYGEAGLAGEGTTPPANTVECVFVPSPATASAALDANATVTQDASGFISAINGYPSAAGGETASADPIPVDDEGSTPWGWIIGVIALVVVAIIVALASRSRRSKDAQGSSDNAGV